MSLYGLRYTLIAAWNSRYNFYSDYGNDTDTEKDEIVISFTSKTFSSGVFCSYKVHFSEQIVSIQMLSDLWIFVTIYRAGMYDKESKWRLSAGVVCEMEVYIILF